MGTTAHVVVTGGTDQHLALARHRIATLEARWSRFLPDSEISSLNRCSGRSVQVSADTFSLVEHAVIAWGSTAGRFDPTVLHAVRAAGYDRDFALLTGDGDVTLPAADRYPTLVADGSGVRVLIDAPAALAAPGGPGPSPGCRGVELDRAQRTVTLPPGVGIDPGGIGKGLAADIVTAELADAGAAGSMVNLGGDLRVRGEPPEGGAWSIAVEDPREPDRLLFTLGLPDGAVATSSRLRRRWTRDGVAGHHLVDPRTGRPSGSPLVAVTTVAGQGWWAEAAAKSVLIAGAPASRTDVSAALVATVDAAGTIDLSPELARIVT